MSEGDELDDEDVKNAYSTSVMMISTVKDPEDLVDLDLISLLAFIKTLALPSEAEIAEKSV